MADRLPLYFCSSCNWAGDDLKGGWFCPACGVVVAQESVPRPAPAKCYMSHPAMPVGDGAISGGSCIKPIRDTFSVYIGFDRGMKVTSRQFPWVKGCEILFPIKDGGVPDDEVNFRRLVEWTAKGCTVPGAGYHAGCIGGHGRTGMFFAALIAVATDEPDPILYVREHYCKKAVETEAQVEWLAKHYSCPKHPGTYTIRAKQEQKADVDRGWKSTGSWLDDWDRSKGH